MSSQIWWYMARASGIVAWLMLTASVLWGVLLSTKAFPKHRRKAWLLDLHRWLGALTLAFIGLHIASLVADSYTHFGLADVLVPLASAWRPVAVALGVVSGWLLLTVQLTSLAMKRLPRKVWHAIHLSSYATFWLTSLHAALAGSDRANLLYIVTAALGVAAVAGATIYRILDRTPSTPPARPAPVGVARTRPAAPSTGPARAPRPPVARRPEVPQGPPVAPGPITVQPPPPRAGTLVGSARPRSAPVDGTPPSAPDLVAVVTDAGAQACCWVGRTRTSLIATCRGRVTT